MQSALKFLVALIVLAAIVLPSPAQQSDDEVTKDVALKSIATFREDPESERGHVAAAIIIRFAKESSDVQVSAGKRYLPWMEAQPVPKESSALLTAYIAGSVRSQLESGKTKNDPLAGEEQVIETYHKLQQTKPDLRIETVEKLIELQKQGKLKDYLDSK
jgi:hypothetical protein